MEPKFQSSFIPKASLAHEAKKSATSQAAAMGLVTLAGLILFLSAVALSVGVFLYEQYLKQSIQSKTESLARARAAFEPALLEELARLDKRINTATNLLNSHIAPSALFDALEASTLQGVRFKSFAYTVLEPGKVDIALDGEATSFASVALQSDVFGNSPLIRAPIFSDLNLNQQGNVVFRVSATLDPSLLSFGATVSGRNSAASSGTNQSGSQVGQTASVTIASRAFSPASLRIQAGTEVTFTNNDTVPHTVTSDTNSSAGGLDSGTLQPGESYTFTFTNGGTYSYHCEIHPSMKATITVVQ